MDLWMVLRGILRGGFKAVQNHNLRIKGYLWRGWTYPVDRDPWSLTTNANTHKVVWITKELTYWIWGENVEKKRYLWVPLVQHPPFLPYCHQSQQALWSREGLGCLFLPVTLKHENSSDSLYTVYKKKCWQIKSIKKQQPESVLKIWLVLEEQCCPGICSKNNPHRKSM